MDKERREFIRNSGIVSLGFIGLNLFATNSCKQVPSLGFGPLKYKKGEILSLPEGFTSTVISMRGDEMDDGLISPGSHDGMGVFGFGSNKMLLVRNHELTPGSYGSGPYGNDNLLLDKIDKSKIYDFGKGKAICVGGTTTMLFNESTQQVEREFLSLTGTVRNCSGGRTPWNSWITCEETEQGIGNEEGSLEKQHGYNFEVPATNVIKLAEPIPIKSMGRFVHESVAVQPETGIVYQTEDTGDSLFYRYLPNTKPTKYGDLHKGGRLQCLVLKEWKGADTRNWEGQKSDIFPQKKLFDVQWVDLEDVEDPSEDLRIQGQEKGAAIFASGEGLSYGNNELYFTASSGGRVSLGQIFRYIPSKYEGQPQEKDHPGQLELFLETPDEKTFKYCDNVAVAPWGDVIICEDTSDPRIIGVTPKGEAYVIAQNVGYRESEFAGPAFSPSGNTLFVNIQSPGLTLAIRGPWKI
ncbi:MAG: alkaline phosphatase PhoX [Bacteroidota bacterium]